MSLSHRQFLHRIRLPTSARPDRFVHAPQPFRRCIARLERHHRRLTALTGLQNYTPLLLFVDVAYVHENSLTADCADFADSFCIRNPRRVNSGERTACPER